MSIDAIILTIATVCILFAIFLTSEWDFKDSIDGLQGNDKLSERGISPNIPINNFSSLIDAIRYEGMANREEEKREDRGKRFRDNLTIIILVATFAALSITCVAIFQQVGEMQRAYQPIADQAQAAKDNMVAEHRAWIGATSAAIDPLVIGQPIHAKIFYNNAGREPAPLAVSFQINTYTYDDWFFSGKSSSDIVLAHDECFAARDNINPNLIAFPGLVSNSYTYEITTTDRNGNPTFKIDESIISGNKIVVLLGCFLYKTYNEIRHTSYCGFDLSGTTVITNLSYCSVGNDAN